jgi:paraquat-inducible protein B
MSRRANPKVVGAFVLGAVGLIVAGVVAFGSGAFLHDRPRAVVFFDGAITGLSDGAPVNVRGVRVGSVKNIKLNLHAEDLKVDIAVYVEFEPERISAIGNVRTGILRDAVANGLRAKLISQSFVTGQLAVELDYLPETPIRLVGLDRSVPEIPTVKSDLESVKEFIGNLPLEELVGSALKTLQSIDQLASSPELRALPGRLLADVDEAKLLLASLRETVEPISTSLLDTSAQARDTLKSADQQMTLIGTKSETALKSIEQAAKQAEVALTSVNSLVARGSAQRGELDQTMRNLSALTASLRSLADQLERNPQILLTGKRQ